MEDSKRIPEIRFTGFTDPWEQRKLGEVAEFNPEGNLPEEFEYVDLESVVGTEMISHRRESRSTAPSRAQRLARTGDIFYQTVRPYQKNNYLFELPDENYVFSTGYAQLRTAQDSRFLFNVLQRSVFVGTVLDRCTGTSYPTISPRDMSEIEIAIPPQISEQQQIGAFFRRLDSLITLHQRKLDRLKNVKKSMLDKMFPKSGESVPEIRFAGFTDPWEQRKLGEVASFTKGVGYSKSDIKKQGTPFVHYGRLYTSYQLAIRNVDAFVEEIDGSFVSTGHEVITPSSGETAEDIAIASAVLSTGIIIGGGLNVVLPSSLLDSVFLALSISYGAQHKELVAKAQGKSVVHLYNDDLADSSLQLPHLDEQQAIGSFFQRFDSLITLHQRKLDQLKNVKKSMLDKMFVKEN